MPKIRSAFDPENEEGKSPELKLASEDNISPLRPSMSAVETYVKRRAEVAEQDHAEFQGYLAEKQEAAPTAAVTVAEKPKPNVSRRTMLKVAVGTSIVGEAAALGYSALTGGSVSEQGLKHAGQNYTEAQRHNIPRELIGNRADVGGRSLGKWIALLPTKLGGGTYALDLNSNRVLASVWYWNYGDYNPISHHLCAFPSADPYHDFEFINSTQGGKNCLIYGIPTNITEPAEGFNIYRVRYDGAQMQVMENVSETTGLGLGVHVTVNPKDAQSYFVNDGQKDIAACFDRTTSSVIAALKYDWQPNSRDLAESWIKGRP